MLISVARPQIKMKENELLLTTQRKKMCLIAEKVH